MAAAELEAACEAKERPLRARDRRPWRALAAEDEEGSSWSRLKTRSFAPAHVEHVQSSATLDKTDHHEQ